MPGTTILTPRSDQSTVVLTFNWPGVKTLAVERKPAGGRYVPIRSGLDLDLDVDGAGNPLGTGTVTDFEAEMDVALTYRITQVDPATTVAPVEVGPVTLDSLGWSWLKDPALPFRNTRLDEVTNIEVETYSSRAGIFDVIDRARPVVVAALRQDKSSQLDMTTQSEAQRTSMLNLLSTGQVLLLATPGASGWGNTYVHVGDVTSTRIGLRDEPSRRWALPVTVVDRPVSLSFQPAVMTWADVVHDWITWSDLIDEVATWADLISGMPG